MKKLICLLLVLLLAGCGAQPEAPVGEQPQDTAAATEQTLPQTQEQTLVVREDLFTDRDYRTDYADHAVITLNGTAAQCASDAVQCQGSTVTITDEGTYVLSGELTDGTVIVNADKKDKVQLVLQEVSIHSQIYAPVCVLQADKVFVTLIGESALSNGGSFVQIDDNNVDAVIFSKEDLTLNGSGTLTVTSPAGHGIVSKDELSITGGTYMLNTASHGIAGKDNVCIADGSFTITAGKDGIRAENDEDTNLGFAYIEKGSFVITAEGDGISASADMQILDGSFTITTGGGSENGDKQTSDNWGGFMGGGRPGGMGGSMGGSMHDMSTEVESDSTSIKGIKAAGTLTISGGTFTIDSADDAVHSNGNLTVSGGSFTIATGDDGFHADETLTIDGGKIQITESYEGLEGLHVKVVGGEISLVASDDGLNAAGGTDGSGVGNRNDMFGGRPGGMMGGMSGNSDGSIVISGGSLQVVASGDGIDANGYLEITGGYTTVTGPTQGDTATLDYDISATISGGTFIGTGGAGMAQTFSDSQQGVIAVSVGNLAAGTQITLTDASGKQILTHAPEMAFAVVILSSPDVVKGESYTITVGTQSGTFEAS